MVLDLETYYLRVKGLGSEENTKRKIYVLRLYDRFLEERKLEPGVESLSLWLDELARRGLSPGTIQVYAYIVLNYFDVMMVDVDEKKLAQLKRRLPTQSVEEVDYLSVEEVARLIDVAPPPYKIIYALCYTYARRVSEVLNLTWDDIDLKRGTITFTILKKKRGSERVTYELEPWIKDLIVKYRHKLGKVKLFNVKRKAVHYAFRRDCKHAGIEANGRRLRPHILRHSRVTHLASSGVPLDFISKYLVRHSRFDTTVQYYRGVTREEVQAIPKAGDMLWGARSG